MASIDKSYRSKLWLYTVLTLALLACLWAGWHDFDPWIPQEEVRENVRSTIRWTVQTLIQYVIPGAIVIFFGKEALARLHGKKRRSSREP